MAHIAVVHELLGVAAAAEVVGMTGSAGVLPAQGKIIEPDTNGSFKGSQASFKRAFFGLI